MAAQHERRPGDPRVLQGQPVDAAGRHAADRLRHRLGHHPRTADRRPAARGAVPHGGAVDLRHLDPHQPGHQHAGGGHALRAVLGPVPARRGGTPLLARGGVGHRRHRVPAAGRDLLHPPARRRAEAAARRPADELCRDDPQRVTFDRGAALERLATERFDVLVVGGGITGAGVALDAASRGLRTALVERDDFASGTSSKSSKLVHGGLRYLQNGDVRLVYEALAERQRLRKNAPHLVKILPFLIPVFSKDGLINPKIARAMGSAMWMYDLTGGARIGKVHKRLRKEQAVEYMPTLPEDRLAGAYLYYDAQADDARLTLTIARTAALEFGAAIVNGCSIARLEKDGAGRVCGATVLADGSTFTVRAAAVVNATGVWADDVRALDEG